MFSDSLIGNAALAIFEAMLIIFAGLGPGRVRSKYCSRPASGARLRHPLPQADDAPATPNSVPRLSCAGSRPRILRINAKFSVFAPNPARADAVFRCAIRSRNERSGPRRNHPLKITPLSR